MEVATWMSRNVEVTQANELLEVAEEKMRRRGCRHLPVVDEKGALQGVLSDHDMREHHGYYATTKVSGAMVEKPITVTPDTSINDAGRLLLKHRIGCLPVVDAQGQLVGIITSTDLLRGLLQLPAEPVA
jgi:CBS domain-containing protein